MEIALRLFGLLQPNARSPVHDTMKNAREKEIFTGVRYYNSN